MNFVDLCLFMGVFAVSLSVPDSGQLSELAMSNSWSSVTLGHDND